MIDEHGYGKRIFIDNIPLQGRNTKGVRVAQDKVLTSQLASEDDLILAIGSPSTICFYAKELPVLKSNISKGVSIIKDSIIQRISVIKKE